MKGGGGRRDRERRRSEQAKEEGGGGGGPREEEEQDKGEGGEEERGTERGGRAGQGGGGGGRCRPGARAPSGEAGGGVALPAHVLQHLTALLVQVLPVSGAQAAAALPQDRLRLPLRLAEGRVRPLGRLCRHIRASHQHRGTHRGLGDRTGRGGCYLGVAFIAAGMRGSYDLLTRGHLAEPEEARGQSGRRRDIGAALEPRALERVEGRVARAAGGAAVGDGPEAAAARLHCLLCAVGEEYGLFRNK